MDESLQEWLALIIVGINFLVILWWWLRKRLSADRSTKKGCTTCASNTSCASTGDKNIPASAGESANRTDKVIILKATNESTR